MLRIFACCLILASCGCSNSRLEGSGDSRNSFLRGYATRCEGELRFMAPDQRTLSPRQTVPAGRQVLALVYQSAPFSGDDPNSRSFSTCIDVAHYSVQFNSKPDFNYRFYVDGDPASGRPLFVMESIEPGSVEAAAIPAEIDQTANKRICGVELRYGECLGPRR